MKTIMCFIFLAFLFTGLSETQPNLTFKENKNQWPRYVLFGCDLPAGHVFIEQTGLTWQLFSIRDIQAAHDKKNEGVETTTNINIVHGHNFKVQFLNAELKNYSTGKIKPEYYNYFLGNNPSLWSHDVKAFESVIFKNAYKNIDLKFYSLHGNIKYDFIIGKAGDVSLIKLRYSYTDGISLKNNKLIIKTSVGDIIESIPEAYQFINGKKEILKCNYILSRENEVSFEVDKNYNPNYELVIDPSIVVASYSGTESVSFGLGVAPDKAGNMFLYSQNITKNYPVTLGAVQLNFYRGLMDCTISKFNSIGTAKFFSTYIGGNKEETIINCVIKDAEIAVFGTTYSDTFPIINNGFQTKMGGAKDYFVLKLDTSGKTLIGSTFLGGKRTEGLTNLTNGTDYFIGRQGEMVMDNLHNCYIIGNSISFDFPTTPASYKPYSDSTNFGDLVISKLNPNLSQLSWSTYFGGDHAEAPTGIRLGKSGLVYCVGTTASTNFYTTSGAAYPLFIHAPDLVGFGLDSANGYPIVSTYLGSKGNDEGLNFDTDINDNLYITGTTLSPQTVTATPGTYNSTTGKVMFMKVKSDLSQVTAIAKFGYSNAQTKLIEIDAMNVDSCGNIYFGGFGLPGLPVTPDAFKATGSTKGNMYLGVFNPDFSSLKFGSYFGGASLVFGDHDDGGVNYFDDRGYFYHAICVYNDVPVTPNAYSQYNVKDSIYEGSNYYGKNSDAFVKIDLNTFVNATSTLGGELKGCTPITATFIASTNLGTISIIPGDGSPAVNSNSLVYTYNTYGTYNAYVIAGIDTTTCNQSDSIKTIIKFGPAPLDALSDSTNNCIGIPDALNARNDGSTYLWSTGQTSQFISPQRSGKYYVNIDNGYCSITDSSYITMLPAQYPMILPNIITPNNDNINDTWDFSRFALDDMEFIVYNRWGTPVFKTNNGDTKWNGVNQSGYDLSDGTYFWVLNCRSNCKPAERLREKGFIQIAR